ncbi:MAG: 30S ribosomal protein S20 [Candidatus Pacebacteria bacterium]|nr:30S ribosomal protein S20 [Candidatus Paceibacterota bacterium]
MITKSAQKAYRQNVKRRAKNLNAKRALKDILKKYKKLVSAGDIKAAQAELPKVYKTLDKAAKENLIKKNKASRLKSRMTKLIAKKAK